MIFDECKCKSISVEQGVNSTEHIVFCASSSYFVFEIVFSTYLFAFLCESNMQAMCVIQNQLPSLRGLSVPPLNNNTG